MKHFFCIFVADPFRPLFTLLLSSINAFNRCYDLNVQYNQINKYVIVEKMYKMLLSALKKLSDTIMITDKSRLLLSL